MYLFEGVCVNYSHHGPRRVYNSGSELPWMTPIPENLKIIDRIPGASFGFMKTMVLTLLGWKMIIHHNSSIFDFQGLIYIKVEHVCLSTYSEV